MNPDDAPTISGWEKYLSGYLIWIWIGPVIFIVTVILLLALARSTMPATQNAGVRKANTESAIGAVQQSLTQQTDVNACRNAVQQINTELNTKPELRPPTLTAEQKNWLRDKLGPNSDEVAEIDSVNYTRLDSSHLEQCFLLRDAAQALEVKSARGRAAGQAGAETPLHQAERAFAWVMRQVRLREGRAGEMPIPAALVLRRGWGTARERALVFLALLEQLGDTQPARPQLLGCLMEVPDKSGRLALWACGVIVGDGKEVYVFDPRLGLPLPGPDGKGIATLAAICKQPEILAQLKIGDAPRYDVTSEQARTAQALLVCSLSALAPRMRHLQEKLLAPAVNVRLASDAAGDLERLRLACAAGVDKPIPVSMAKEEITELRRFLPPEEGGVDANARKQLFARALIPRDTMPAQFRDPEKYPRNSPLGQTIDRLFTRPFLNPMLEAGGSRDLLLRGRYSSAVSALVTEQEGWQNQIQQRANAVDLEEKVEEWWRRAIHAYSVQKQAKGAEEREQADKEVKALWTDRQAASLYVYLYSSAAMVRNAEVAYQLGLCSQEQAEQWQARLEVTASSGGEAAHRTDNEKARKAWESARNAWKQLEDEFPDHPDLAAARRLRGRAEAMLGDKKAALAAWKENAAMKDAPGRFQTSLEKLAALYLAHQLEKQ
jgi:hypothetical protein